LSFGCAAPQGAQEELIRTEPDRFFRPPYVGHRGWIGVRLDGAAYLAFLGVQALRSARRGSPLGAAPERGRVAGSYAYLRGAITNLANPKQVTFVVALLPQFVDRALGHVPLQFAVLGAIFIAFEALVDGTVGLMAGRIGAWLSRRRRARQALDAGAGTIMMALAARLAAER
jgi:threonine/homoserine/homoserine lactone efflux protein